jgi:hypothetical protein
MQVQVIQKPLKYGTRQYAIGDLIEMTAKHARLFMAINRVGVPSSPRPDIPASPSLPVTIVETDGDYETVDIQAEISPRTGKPKRQYRRRDMQAE